MHLTNDLMVGRSITLRQGQLGSAALGTHSRRASATRHQIALTDRVEFFPSSVPFPPAMGPFAFMRSLALISSCSTPTRGLSALFPLAPTLPRPALPLRLGPTPVAPPTPPPPETRVLVVAPRPTQAQAQGVALAPARSSPSPHCLPPRRTR